MNNLLRCAQVLWFVVLTSVASGQSKFPLKFPFSVSAATNVVVLTPDMGQTALSNAFRTAPNNSYIIFRGEFTNLSVAVGSIYLSDSNAATALFKLNSRTNVVIEGDQGAQIRIHGGAGNLFEYRSCERVTTRNLDVGWVSRPLTPNDKFSVVFGYGLGSRQLVYDRVRVVNFHNHAINEQIFQSRTSSNVTVEGSTFINGGITNFNGSYPNTDGAAVQVSTGDRIVNCTFDSCARGIEIEGAPGNGIQDDTLISGNHFINLLEFGVFNITHGKGHRLKIVNNIFRNTVDVPPGWPNYGIYLLAGNDTLLQGNTFERVKVGTYAYAGSSGMRNLRVMAEVYRSNNVAFACTQSLGTLQGLVINGCQVENCITGFRVDASEYSILGNVLRDCGASAAGIYLFRDSTNVSSGNGAIVGNVITETRTSPRMTWGVAVTTGVTNVSTSANVVRGQSSLAITNFP